MPLFLLPNRLLPLPSSPLITCHASPAALRSSSSSPPPTLPNLLDSTTSVPSLSCALQCPHFQSCSGCSHEFNLHRPIIVDEADHFFKTLGVSDFDFESCRLWGWRSRAKLAVRGSSMKPLIGLYEEGTHNVVDIPHCKAHHPNINAAVELLRQGITKLNIEPFDEDEGTGELRYVQMALTTYNTSIPASERYKNGKVQVSLVWNSRNENSHNFEKLNALANFLWRNGGPRSDLRFIHSVWANFQTSTNNIIFGNRWRHLLGESGFWEHVGGIDMSLAPSSFGQANTRAFDILLRKLQKYVPYGASVTDLYAGAGAIGLSLAATRKCRSVKCVEVNKESKLSFEKTVERLPNHVDSSISWHHADASDEPLSWLMGSEVVVVDPPRKGLDASLLDALRNISSLERKAKSSPESSDSKVKDEKRPWVLRSLKDSVQIGSKPTIEDSGSLPQTLLYISCGWESFKEDCMTLLSSKKWRLQKAHGFNFFPGTQSIEVLAVFKRGQAASLKKKKSGKKKKRLGRKHPSI
ncbi:RNA methyltransferase pc [Salix suchowensis]|nr:RNA methyltransferase pc [Salix suchowensis]